ncbi:hypothetical protein HGRIS_010549 [Hohenbuehelia grisea]|uniref:HNH domain-containing protein n=1 Tax=Hohenbuehelia grisea TaxID=104357 RepID=A0ABR3IX23_9AGAR
MSMSSPQFVLFQDCLARRILSLPAFQSNELESSSSASSSDSSSNDLSEFVDFLANEAWPNLPPIFHTLTHDTHLPTTFDADLDSSDAPFLSATPVAFVDTMIAYGLSEDEDAAYAFLRRVLHAYVADAMTPPPAPSSTRTRECEICEREVPLTYHHLIPRATHAKVLKRKLHPEHQLNSVAWICRPCHNVVHHVASNDELAQSFYTVDLLLEREDVQKWRRYAAKQRFGVRRG